MSSSGSTIEYTIGLRWEFDTLLVSPRFAAVAAHCLQISFASRSIVVGGDSMF